MPWPLTSGPGIRGILHGFGYRLKKSKRDTDKESDAYVRTSENNTKVKSEQIALSQTGKVLILNYSMDSIFFFNLDTFSFGGNLGGCWMHKEFFFLKQECHNSFEPRLILT